MTRVRTEPLVLIVVPNGTHRPEPLAEAVMHAHPSWEVRAVWAGDPHLRPMLSGDVRWLDDPFLDDALFDEAWQRTLVSTEPLPAEWSMMLSVCRRAIAGSASSVVALWAGAVAVLGSLDALVLTSAPAMVVRRVEGPLPADGCVPTEHDLAQVGNCSPHMIGFSGAAEAVIDWIEQRIAADPQVAIGKVLDRAIDAFALECCTDPGIGSGAWRWHTAEPHLLDLPGFDPDKPWILDPDRGDRGRIAVVGHPDRQAALLAASEQLRGERRAITLPGGLRIDATIRSIGAEAGATAPPPWTAPKAFRTWLESRYWSALHRSRRDLAGAFPRPYSRDAESFDQWSRRAFIDDEMSVLVGVPERHIDRWDVDADLSLDGINLVGYLTRESSLGDVARRLLTGLRESGVATAPLAHQRTASPELETATRGDERISYATTLAVVNADQFAALQMDHPELFTLGARTIGYWFWELEHVPAHMRTAIGLVDEIWAGSTFVADAFAAVTDRPVRRVAIPVPEPMAAGRERLSFPSLQGFGDRFVFAVVFDYFSVAERKNPVGAIEAFRRAFSPGEGPVMVVKSMNADQRWPQHERLRAAAEGRPDIILWDEHLERSDHMAFIRCVDALVSLHRSEGLGLHLAEAMWLGTPVIATRYSGNLDFMDDDSAALADATLVPVQHGEGVYPPEAFWADPDLEQAAAAMRRMVHDPQWAADLAAAARRRMEQQPTLADTGRHIADLLGLQQHAPDGSRVAS